jgi:Uma2 family endonuclease
MATQATRTKPVSDQKLVLENVDWQTYSRLLRTLSDRRNLHMTYDRGRLELMTLSLGHENFGRFLGWIILVLVEELALSVKQGGSTTFRRRKKQRGLESDNCYWIQNAALMRGKKKIDLRKDPPPDVALEVDITHSSLNRMSIYASLKVPEIWQSDGKSIRFHILQPNGKYTVEAQSRAFPGLASLDLVQFLALLDQEDENAIIGKFRTWVRQKFNLAKP